MNGTSSRVPIEQLVEFPTRFSFKVVGRNRPEFAADALSAARRLLGPARSIESRIRESRQASYLSVTLTARIRTAEELQDVYAALRGIDGMITVL